MQFNIADLDIDMELPGLSTIIQRAKSRDIEAKSLIQCTTTNNSNNCSTNCNSTTGGFCCVSAYSTCVACPQ